MVDLAAKNDALVRQWEQEGFLWKFGVEIEFSLQKKQDRLSSELIDVPKRAAKRLRKLKTVPLEQRNPAFLDEDIADILAYLKEPKTPEELFLLTLQEALQDDYILEGYGEAYWRDGPRYEVRIAQTNRDGSLRTPGDVRRAYERTCDAIERLGARYGFNAQPYLHHVNYSFWKWDPALGDYKNLTQLYQGPGDTVDSESAAATLNIMDGIVQAAGESYALLYKIHQKTKLSDIALDEVLAYPHRSSWFRMGRNRFEDRFGVRTGKNPELLDAQILTTLAGARIGLSQSGPPQYAALVKCPEFDIIKENAHAGWHCFRELLDSTPIAPHEDGDRLISKPILRNWTGIPRTVFGKYDMSDAECEPYHDYIETAIDGITIRDGKIDTSGVPEGPESLRDYSGRSAREAFMKAMEQIRFYRYFYQVSAQCPIIPDPDLHRFKNSERWSSVVGKTFLEDWVKEVLETEPEHTQAAHISALHHRKSTPASPVRA